MAAMNEKRKKQGLVAPKRKKPPPGLSISSNSTGVTCRWLSGYSVAGSIGPPQ